MPWAVFSLIALTRMQLEKKLHETSVVPNFHFFVDLLTQDVALPCSLLQLLLLLLSSMAVSAAAKGKVFSKFCSPQDPTQRLTRES